MNNLKLKDIGYILPIRVEIDEFREADMKSSTLFKGQYTDIPEELWDRKVFTLIPMGQGELTVVLEEKND